MTSLDVTSLQDRLSRAQAELAILERRPTPPHTPPHLTLADIHDVLEAFGVSHAAIEQRATHVLDQCLRKHSRQAAPDKTTTTTTTTTYATNAVRASPHLDGGDDQGDESDESRPAVTSTNDVPYSVTSPVRDIERRMTGDISMLEMIKSSHDMQTTVQSLSDTAILRSHGVALDPSGAPLPDVDLSRLGSGTSGIGSMGHGHTSQGLYPRPPPVGGRFVPPTGMTTPYGGGIGIGIGSGTGALSAHQVVPRGSVSSATKPTVDPRAYLPASFDLAEEDAVLDRAKALIARYANVVHDVNATATATATATSSVSTSAGRTGLGGSTTTTPTKATRASPPSARKITTGTNNTNTDAAGAGAGGSTSSPGGKVSTTAVGVLDTTTQPGSAVGAFPSSSSGTGKEGNPRPSPGDELRRRLEFTALQDKDREIPVRDAALLGGRYYQGLGSTTGPATTTNYQPNGIQTVYSTSSASREKREARERNDHLGAEMPRPSTAAASAETVAALRDAAAQASAAVAYYTMHVTTPGGGGGGGGGRGGGGGGGGGGGVGGAFPTNSSGMMISPLYAALPRSGQPPVTMPRTSRLGGAGAGAGAAAGSSLSPSPEPRGRLGVAPAPYPTYPTGHELGAKLLSAMVPPPERTKATGTGSESTSPYTYQLPRPEHVIPGTWGGSGAGFAAIPGGNPYVYPGTRG